jgi:hypothetical protein
MPASTTPPLPRHHEELIRPGLGTRRLETLSQNLYGKPLADLGSIEASGLIDVLKDIKAGKIDCQTALKGVGS